MAKLTTAARKKLPASEFAGPDKSYPIPDRSHAANAKARASEMEHKGTISKATEKKIDARADRRLGERNASRTADRVVARLSQHKNPR
jgi:hypothetical protein